MGYAIPIEVYEAIKKAVKDENTAREIIKTIEKSLDAIEEKAKQQKVIVKSELKEELRKELVTKEEFYGETGKLRQEMETLRQEIKGEIKEIRAYLKFITVLIIIGFTVFNPNFAELIKALSGFFK